MGRLLALTLTVATVLLIAIATLWPDQSTMAMMAGTRESSLRRSSSPQAAAEIFLGDITRRDWDGAYARLANKSEFTLDEFERDLTGGYPSLRSQANLGGFTLHPLHATNDDAEIKADLQWTSVVGQFQDVRNLHVVRNGDEWQVAWPLVKEQRVPPQVIAVNYLRWDVIYRGPEDDWGAQDVEGPHIRIVDMNPVARNNGVSVLGEILNEDVVPAFVTVKATLVAKDGTAIATEDAFDKISHVLLPKQVSPFRIDFHDVRLADVDSVNMHPSSSLISASADPVVEIEDQTLTPLPQASLTGKLMNQSGQIVNIAHVLGTFYDARGQLQWVSDGYVNRALLPRIPAPFAISIPADIAGKINNYRVITSTYSSNRFE
jgi:hypothetical protein